MIPAISPDVVVIHAAQVDEQGNARVYGSPFWDHPLARAAKRVLRLQPELTMDAATESHAKRINDDRGCANLSVRGA